MTVKMFNAKSVYTILPEDRGGTGERSLDIVVQNLDIITADTIIQNGAIKLEILPDLSWDKITIGRPTTLAGYGITDAAQLGDLAAYAPGVASAGVATTAARSDHVHPMQTAVSGNAGTATKLQLARNINGVAFDGSADITINAVDSTDRIASSEKGVANGVATLDDTGKVPVEQLPSYVDDVVEYAALANFPVTGETSRIYVALDTNKVYRWSGSLYIEISSASDTSLTADKLTTARTLTIGDTGKAFDGSANVSWSLSEIGAVASNTAITPATATKVTYDAKGLVTAGSILSEEDIPALSWSKITSGTPTTLSGYGITDATPSTHVGSTGIAHGVATTTEAGFMSATDKTKLDGLSAGQTSVNRVNLNDLTHLESSTLTTTSTDTAVLLEFPVEQYGSCKLLIQAREGNLRHVTELLVINNTTAAEAVEYGTLFSSYKLFMVDVAVNAGKVVVLITPTVSDEVVFKVNSTLMVA